MTSPGFRPTHVVPQDGLPAWESPDPSRPTVPLDALLPVELVDRLGDWGRVLCANGWSAWVDGRLLIAVPQVPPAATRPLARTADPRPLLARVEQALTAYRQAAEELAAGRLEAEAFRARTQGSRIGVVVDGESMWLYDGEHERWVYCDGARLSTFAAGTTPSAAPRESPRRPEEHEPPGDGPPEPESGSAPEPAAAAEPSRCTEPGRAPEPGTARGRQAEPTRIVRESASGGPPEGPPGGHEPTRLVTFDDDRGED
ncbi:hypothetical protein [Streptomyces aureus]|uniref:hypothetical protein n=1 Tax=Streptomyces aureus TaxID=193461 RepID=UPI00056C4B3F|nr:hypothetical protein [Streptomyces aureus]